ncbi:hypothetical protein HCN44_004027 [Aphidius gifuensis]|uniref:Uncharacterized protein n=1 Tax=Aphidius gifuensis TaxID=684658 RepID=A0A834XYU1_APHGI|nr:N-acetyltransferase eco [Aphidius gifuensis]KAF7994555.1 hypothetical protein HCN44_004027 [Aphidius gifuensis]
MMSQESQVLSTVSSLDSGQGDSICTPKRVQKCLFNKPDGSSSKRNLMKLLNSIDIDTTADKSGDESDLGPMSPLALTDRSSNYDSSPGRQYDSPFTSPEKQSPRSTDDWDRLRPLARNKNNHDHQLTPFSHLKKITRAARSSPSRKLYNILSPKLIPLTPERYDNPNDNTMFNNYDDDTIIPETPQKDNSSITETPKKKNHSEKRMNTPIGSISQSIITVPPLHRRKSLSALDNCETSSPENTTLKRSYPTDDNNKSNAKNKIAKIDDNTFTTSRARASLFQEDNNQNLPTKCNFTLSTKSFYNNNNIDDNKISSCFGWKKIEPIKKRHSLPSVQSNSRRSGGYLKKLKTNGCINAGVMHGIKKKKKLTKRRSDRLSIGANKSTDDKKNSPVNKINEPMTVVDNVEENENITLNETDNTDKVINKIVKQPVNVKKIIVRPPSPVEDPNKRFFKTNRTLKSNNIATITVNENIKLNVSDGKFALKEKRKLSSKFCYPIKKQKVNDLIFDTTDLCVDEPEFNTSIEKKQMDGILKVLEDDWAVDDYDTMEPLMNQSKPKSPMKKLTNVSLLMSPGSVLSDMTSSMNIKDQAGMMIDEQMKIQNDNVVGGGGGDEGGTAETSQQINSTEQQKYYPLFAKGYKDTIEVPSDDKKRGVKRGWGGGEMQYQLDAGQKRFGATQCNECGVIYQMGEPEDENSHLIYHNSFKILKFNGWKNEHVIMEDIYTASRIITIKKTDPKHCWKKVEEVLGVVDRDLGLADMELTDYQDKTIYLYIRDKNVLGVLIAESIKEAHQMIPELADLNCCSTESTPAKCGVNVIWTAMSHRRQHIATKLLDILRTNYFYGYILSLDDIAFSMPTPTGRQFAAKYFGSLNFKVYS